MCGRPIGDGDLAQPLTTGAAFTSFMALTPSAHTCGWCASTRDQRVMRHLQRTVITERGCYPIGSDDARAWLLLSPPEPPLAIVINQSSALATFHLHWRTPVTIDANLLVVRVEERVLHIRRPVLLEALGWAQELATAMDKLIPVKKRKTNARHHPFVSLDRRIEAPGHGALSPHALALSQTHPSLVDRLDRLWPGELWALATLAKANPPTPTPPTPTTCVD